MKKRLSYRDKLIELAYIYNVKEIHFVFSLQAGETKSVYYTYRKEWK